jgi:hypothetical protein
MKQTFFEAISVASMEKIHSAMISWIFSDNCDAISNYDKSNILNTIFGIENNPTYESLNSKTEFDGIDIVIKSDINTFIIENKIKSKQQKGQLKKYEEVPSIKNWPEKHFGFITLIGEKSESKNWKNLIYDELLDQFNKLTNIKSNADGIILNEYISSLNNLIEIKNRFLRNHLEYEFVFRNGRIAKSKKNESVDYISINQLETLFQKIFLIDLAYELQSLPAFSMLDKYEIREFGGQADLCYTIASDVTIGYKDLDRKPVNFTFEFQDGTFKIACSLKDWGKSKSYDPIITYWTNIFTELIEPQYTIQKPQKKGKARVSLTRSWAKNFYTYSKSEIIKRFIEEMQIGQKKISEIINKGVNKSGTIS